MSLPAMMSKEAADARFAELSAKFDQAAELGDIEAMRAVLKAGDFIKVLLAHSVHSAREYGTAFEEATPRFLLGFSVANRKQAAWIDRIHKTRIDQLERRLSDLEHRLAEASALKYCGTWEAGRTYQRGHFVTDGGSVWHCERNGTTQRPGPGDSWILSVKRGANGRDFR